MPPPPPNREEKAMTEPTDPIVELLDTARALRVLALGLKAKKAKAQICRRAASRVWLAYCVCWRIIWTKTLKG